MMPAPTHCSLRALPVGGRKMMARSVLAIPLTWILVGISLTSALNPITSSIREESDPGTFVANVKSASNITSEHTPADVNRMRFDLRLEGNAYNFFDLNSITGVLTTTERIDRETQCPGKDECAIQLDIMVGPSDLFAIIKLTVRLEDVNDHSPVFPATHHTLDISETTSEGALFSLPPAVDEDSGINGVQRYELRYLDRPATLDKFQLKITNQPDGTIDVRLELKQLLDRELEDTYSMQVTAIDGGSPPSSGSITVNVAVSDSNDNNPRFLNKTYTGQVYENASNRTFVLQVRAVDSDSGRNGHIMYGFAAHTLSTYGSNFRIDEESGQIFVNGDIDYESLAVYRLQVTATDMGPNRLSAFARVNINVLDVNDEAPVISVNPFTISGREQVLEHANISTFVAYISVSDADSGVNGEFNCAIDNSDFRLEEQEGSDYRIVTNAVFDREVTSEVAVTMSCTDKGNPPLPSTKLINIHIADINDNVPTLSANNYVVSFKENNSRGDVVVQINATDRDANQNAAIRYEIAPLDDDGLLISSDVIVEETVRMDPITGLITALKQFDYESKTEYKYLLTVSDHGVRPLSSTATMTLSIQDVNDEWPRFQQTAYFMTVSEELPRFTVVGNVSATDDDSSLYNKIIYSIRTSASSDFFRIDLSGEIRTNRELDRERTAEHQVQVIAANQGTPSLNTSVNVTITVLDVNDHAPHLYFPSPTNNTVQMRESIEPGVKVTKVEAVDFDTGDNSLLVYSITRGNEENTFSIDSRTGVIKIAESKLVVNKKTFYLEVTVQDSGIISQVAFQDLNIYVNKSLDAAPSLGGFQGSNLIILISVVCGSILIIVIIVVAVLCVRAHRRHVKKRHNYNCRHQETKKSNGSGTNFDSLNRHSDSSCESVAIAVEGKTVENGHLGTKTKEKSKKEVTFSLDQDDMSSWPPHAQPKPVENPHAHSTEAKTGDPNEDKGQIYSVRGGGVVRKAGEKAGCERDEPGANNPHIAQQQQQQPHQQQQQLHHHHHHHHHHVCRHHRRMQHGQAMLYGGERNLHHLTQGDLEMHDMLNSSVDHESECSCSGSITDSGRGPSEEGDNGLYAYPPPVGDPYYGTEPRGGCCADIPIVDTIIEETELSGDSETGGSTNLSDCPDGSNNHLQLPQPHVGHPSRSGNLRCSPSRTSVDSQASSRCSHRLRHPLKYSNENVHTRCSTPGCGGLSRCPGCRSPIRSSLESVNSAPGRMDINASTSYLKPKRSRSDCSDGSLVSGIVALAGSDEALPKSASKDSINNGMHSAQRSAHCLHSLEDLNSDVRLVSSSRQGCCNPTAHVGRVGNCSTNPTHQHYNSNPRNQRQPQHPYGYTNRNHPYGYIPPSQANRQGPGSYHREPAMFEHGADTLAVMPSLQTLPSEFSDHMPGQPKGVRFAEPQIERAFPSEDTYNHGCYAPDCLSDDGTTTSGSYSLDSVDSNRRQRNQAIHLPGPEEGTCV